jgi:diguanylate cyclase (GGDEF)-like protein
MSFTDNNKKASGDASGRSDSSKVSEALSLLRVQKNDLEIALSTAIEHGDFVEQQLTELNGQLTKEVEERKKAEDKLLKMVEIVTRQKDDLEIALNMAIEHGDAIEQELLDINQALTDEVRERIDAEKKMDSLVAKLSRQKNDLEVLVETIADHGDEINAQMEEQLFSIEHLAKTDGLTGLWNRRTFDEQLELEWNRNLRSDDVLGLLLLDVDFFKKFNDSLGHQQGDKTLQAIASLLKSMTKRSGESAARYGGEEFVIILPNTSIDSLKSIAGQILENVNALKIPHPDSSFGYVTVSIGIAVSNVEKCRGSADLLKMADESLYQAKQSGRNQFCIKTGNND